MVKHDHLLWGTDYPFEIHAGRDLNYYINTLKDIDVPEESMRGFLGMTPPSFSNWCKADKEGYHHDQENRLG